MEKSDAEALYEICGTWDYEDRETGPSAHTSLLPVSCRTFKVWTIDKTMRQDFRLLSGTF